MIAPVERGDCQDVLQTSRLQMSGLAFEMSCKFPAYMRSWVCRQDVCSCSMRSRRCKFPSAEALGVVATVKIRLHTSEDVLDLPYQDVCRFPLEVII